MSNSQSGNSKDDQNKNICAKGHADFCVEPGDETAIALKSA